jgi:hypothetical protein
MKVRKITIRTKHFWTALDCTGEIEFFESVGRAGAELSRALSLDGFTITATATNDFEIAFTSAVDPVGTTKALVSWLHIAARAGGFEWIDDEPVVQVIAPKGEQGPSGIINEALQTMFLSEVGMQKVGILRV